MAGALYTVAPLLNDQRTSPVLALSANIVPSMSIEPAKSTPLMSDTGALTLVKLSGAVSAGSATCQRVPPVAGSRPAHEPTFDMPPFGPPSLYEVPVKLLTGT